MSWSKRRVYSLRFGLIKFIAKKLVINDNPVGIADIWTPPTDQSSHIGKAKKGEIEIQKAGTF